MKGSSESSQGSFTRWGLGGAHTMVVWLVMAMSGAFLIWYYLTPAFWDSGYEPVQPIPFSHRVHVGSLGLDCRFCHSRAESEAAAGLPSPRICWDCHQQIGRYNRALFQLREWIERGVPLYWTRVYRLPDHVVFHHGLHTQARIACTVCHPGIVSQDRTAVRRVPTMRFCLNCHRQPFGMVATVDEVYSAEPSGAGQSEGDQPARTDCSACHR